MQEFLATLQLSAQSVRELVKAISHSLKEFVCIKLTLAIVFSVMLINIQFHNLSVIKHVLLAVEQSRGLLGALVLMSHMRSHMMSHMMSHVMSHMSQNPPPVNPDHTSRSHWLIAPEMIHKHTRNGPGKKKKENEEKTFVS